MIYSILESMTPPTKKAVGRKQSPSAKQPDRIHWIRDPAVIEALVSPVRQNLVDRLEALGPSSVRELAESLRVAPDSLYYHVKMLVKAGVLVAKGEQETRRRDETLYDVVKRNWHIRYEPADPDNTRAVRRLTASLLRQAERDFESGLEDPAAEVSGPARNLWSLRLEACLEPDELENINQHMKEVLAILRKPRRKGGKGTLCAMTWALAPIEKTRGKRRRAAQEPVPGGQ